MMVSKDDIKKAKETNLAAYLSSRGEPLVKNGRRFKHKNHNSLVFTDNLYYWNARQEFGTSIDYLMRNMNMQFTEAVKKLCEFSGVYVDISRPERELSKPDFKINNVEFNDNTKRAVAYLVKTRNLKFEMVVSLVKDGLIAQTKQNANIAFMVKDEKSNYVGIEYNTSISGGRFKGIEKGSDQRYGFNILNCNPGEVKNFFYYEAAIDLLSFKQMNKMPENSIMVSMSGLKECIVKNTLEKFGSSEDKKIYICVDNDAAGINFCKAVKGNYKDMKFLMPKGVKDWNEAIKKNSIRKVLARINNTYIPDSKKLVRNNGLER